MPDPRTDQTLRLTTDRLVLRRFRPSDAPQVRDLCDNWAVAGTLSRVPFPYTLEDAMAWIGGQADRQGEDMAFAVTADGAVVGCAGLHGGADALELGYWIGEPFWGRGYATEAAQALCTFAFDRLDADRLVAGHYHGNEASARVLAKCGFIATGNAAEYSRSRQTRVDLVRVALDRAAWVSARPGDAA